MKESMHYAQFPELSIEQKPAQLQLKTVQKGLQFGWGSIFTFVVMALSFDMPYGFGRGSVLLWFMLLAAPGATALFIWKWPTWQESPMLFRRSVILNGLALSWATYLSLVVFQIAWNLDAELFIVIIAFIGLLLGSALLFVAKRLHNQIVQEGDLFP